MASGWYRATFSIPTDTGLPADTVNNVWSFRHLTDADHTLDAAEIASRLVAFYGAIVTIMSSALDFSHARTTIVDLQDTRPRLPFYDEETAVTGAATTNYDYPAEVAICMSFRGALGSGLNARRRRGRVYLGPLQVPAGDREHIVAEWPAACVDAAVAELAVTTGDVEWCVYSPYTHHDVPVGERLDPDIYPEVTANLFDAFTPVTYVWADNAWDTQRRRGIQATTRYGNTV